VALRTELGPPTWGARLAGGGPAGYRQPRVAILGSGDEIVDVDQPEEILSGRKIASSNSHTLKALVRRTGAEPVDLGIARDTPDSMRTHLQAADGSDLLVTTAGISVGEHDYLRGVLDELGAEQRFWKLRMRPGAPVGFGILKGIPWIGLPGNPVSTMVTFGSLLAGDPEDVGHALPFRRSVPVRLAEPISLSLAAALLRAVVTEGARLRRRSPGPGVGILTSMVAANALLVIPEGVRDPAGAVVQALRLDDPVRSPIQGSRSLRERVAPGEIGVIPGYDGRYLSRDERRAGPHRPLQT
jgi:molybdopterin molybdotransferase